MSEETNNEEKSTLVSQNTDNNKFSEVTEEFSENIVNEINESIDESSPNEDNIANSEKRNSVTTLLAANNETNNVNENKYEIQEYILRDLEYILALIFLHNCLGFISFVDLLCKEYYILCLLTFLSTFAPVFLLSCISIKWDPDFKKSNSNSIVYFFKHFLSELVKYKHYKQYKTCKKSLEIFQDSTETDMQQNYEKSIRNIEDLRYFTATNAFLQGFCQFIAQIWVLIHIYDNVPILPLPISLEVFSFFLIICCIFIYRSAFCDFRSDLGIYRISIFTHFITVMSMTLYFMDIVSDLFVTIIKYYCNGHYIRGTLSFIFVIVPGIYNTWHEHYRTKMDFNLNKTLLFAMILNLNPLYGYYKSMKLLLKTRKAETERNEELQKISYLEYIKNNFIVASSRYNECFTESCSQLLINISFLLATIDFSFWQNDKLNILSSGISVLNVAVSLVLFFRSKRIRKHEEDPLPITGMVIQFVGYIPVASRIVAISFLASIHPWWTFLSMFLHWLLIFIWTISSSNEHSLSIHLNNAGQAFIYIYTPAINNKMIEIIFQTVFFTQNIAAMLIWGFSKYGRITTNTVYLLVFAIVLPSFIGWFCRYLYRVTYDKWIQNFTKDCELRKLNTTC